MESIQTRQHSTDLLTPEQFKSRMPNVGRNSLYQLLRSGRIKSVRLGRKYLIPASELEAVPQREIEAQA